MAINRDGVRYDAAGAPMFRVRVYDAQLRKQIDRRAVGETHARQIEADLLAQVKVPLEQRGATADVIAAGRAQGRPVVTTTNKITVCQWAEQYLELFKQRPDGGVRPFSSWDHDRRCLEFYILPRIGGRSLTSVRLHELQDLVAGSTKRDGVTPLAGATKESIAGTIKRVWKMAERRTEILREEGNRTVGLSTSWGGQSEERAAIVPSMQDVFRLAASIEQQSAGYGSIVELIAFTGLRWEEISALPVSNVSWDDMRVHVEWSASFSGGRRTLRHETKSKAANRFVPIPVQAEAPLRRLMAASERRRQQHPDFGDEILVVTNTLGAALHYNTWRIALDKARHASGVTYTAHPLRHVAASLAISSGMTDIEIAAMMGHRNADYTRKIYGHLFPSDGREVAARMSKAIQAAVAREQALANRTVTQP